MKFFTLAVALAAVVPAFSLTINTPTGVVSCEPTQLNWSGGQGPYYLSILPAAQTTAPALEQLTTTNATSYTWTVNFEQGTSFTIALKDGSGEVAYSDIVTVQGGGSSGCTTSQPSGSSGPAPASTGASGSASAGSTPTGASASASSGSSSTSTASGSSSTHSSGAGRLGVSSAFGVAAVMGLVGAAFF